VEDSGSDDVDYAIIKVWVFCPWELPAGNEVKLQPSDALLKKIVELPLKLVLGSVEARINSCYGKSEEK